MSGVPVPSKRVSGDAPLHATALPRHLPALDGVRGVAICLVVVHMLGLLTSPESRIAALVAAVSDTGWIGVQLFFVLSGFLITGILLDTQRAANYYSGFYARRSLRVFPLYYALVFFVLIVLPLLGFAPAAIEHDRRHQIWLWTYLSNWVQPYEAGSRALPHCWSLAVEEQFYLLWPFVVRRLTPLRCVAVSGVLALVSLGVRIAMLRGGGSRDAIYTFSVTRMDALVLGGAAAAVMRVPAIASVLVAKRRYLWAASAVTGIVGAAFTKRYLLATFAGATVGYSFLAVTFALAVLAAACADAAQDRGWVEALRVRPLRSLGKYSYAVYLFHKPLHDFVGRPLLARWKIDPSHSLPVAASYVVSGLLVSWAAAYASYWLFEQRFLRLKDRFASR